MVAIKRSQAWLPDVLMAESTLHNPSPTWPLHNTSFVRLIARIFDALTSYEAEERPTPAGPNCQRNLHWVTCILASGASAPRPRPDPHCSEEGLLTSFAAQLSPSVIQGTPSLTEARPPSETWPFAGSPNYPSRPPEIILPAHQLDPISEGFSDKACTDLASPAAAAYCAPNAGQRLAGATRQTSGSPPGSSCTRGAAGWIGGTAAPGWALAQGPT
jgi:hypothetical protein